MRMLDRADLVLATVFLLCTVGVALSVQAEASSGVIAFVKEGRQPGIYTIDPSGAMLTRVTNGQDYRPRWSPDGTHIVFQRFSSSSIDSDIYVMNADGSDVQRLTQLGTAYQPAWSPDGSRIVFGSGLGRQSEVFAMNADGTDQVQLTHDQFADTVPAWSPEGNTIAFASRRHRNVDIYLMAPDGSDVRRITRARAKDLNPDWSPDGSHLVFHSHRHSNWDLYTILPDGSGLKRLTDRPAAEWAPAWSPDGTRIAFTNLLFDSGVEDIAVMTVGSHILVRYVFPDSLELEPDWQPV
jgi:Tol biopolymer transport system component